MMENFQSLWNTRFPNKLPISHLFHHDFHEFWFRIHSLPESKRYAEKKEEFALLLSRHNQIITDCFGLNTPIYIVTGHYFYPESDPSKYHPKDILHYNLNSAPSINLHQAAPEIFDDGESNDLCFTSLYVQTNWQPNIHNDLLLKIADDKIKGFLISFEKNIIVAPYDGGIDFIIQDDSFKQQLKEKYRDWLSSRADGL